MRIVIDFGLPLLIMLAMTIVGLEITLADLRRVLHYPAEVALGLLAPALVLPLVAALLLYLLPLQPSVGGGLILVAAAPQAIVSSYFCLLGRANVALSVTLTAASTILAVVSTPLIAGLAFDLVLEERNAFALPTGKVAQQVVIGMLLPVAAGMLVRHFVPAIVAAHRTHFQLVSLGALALLLGVIAFDQAETIGRYLLPLLLAAVLFTLTALALGAGVAALVARPKEDRLALTAALPARSLSVATLVSVNVLGQLEFLSFAFVFFLVQALLIVPAMLMLRVRAEPATT